MLSNAVTQIKDLTLPPSQRKRLKPSPCQVNGINAIDLTGAKDTLRMTDINKITNVHTKS